MTMHRWLLLLALTAAACDGTKPPPVDPPKGNGGTVDPPPTSATPPVPVEPESLSWQRLSGYAYTQRMELPKDVTALAGQKVEIAGYLYPTRQTRDIKEFILMRDQGTCCYGPQAQYNHFVWVRIVKGPGVNFTREPVIVTGTLRVGEKWDGDYLESIYELDAEEHRRS